MSHFHITYATVAIAFLSASGSAWAQEACKVSAQAASNVAQDYRNAVGKVRTSCTKSAGDCDQRRQDADQLLQALLAANAVMINACAPDGGGGGGGGGGGVTPAAPGDLIITEIMADPNAVADTQGEWFEVHNPTSMVLDLKGLTVSNASGSSFVIGSSVIVPSGGYAVLAVNGDPSLNGGFIPNFVYSGMTLTNAGGFIAIHNGSTLIDQAPYAQASASGVARSLSSSAFDAVSNDALANWCPAVTVYGDGDKGTPGAANPVCP